MIEGTEYFQQDRASSLSYHFKYKLLYDASFQQDSRWYLNAEFHADSGAKKNFPISSIEGVVAQFKVDKECCRMITTKW